MPKESKITVNVRGNSVEFSSRENKLYASIGQKALTINGNQYVSDINRFFEVLPKSHFILLGDQLTILPKAFGGAKDKEEASQIPDEYTCPITHQLMYDPVIAADGETYEREAIERHLQSSDRSPMHGDALTHTMLTTNRALKRTIESFRNKNESADDELYLPTSLVQTCRDAVLVENMVEAKKLLQKEPRLFQYKFDGNQSVLDLSFQTSAATVKSILALYPVEHKPKLTHQLCAKISKALGHIGLQTLTESYQDSTSINIRLESAIAYKSIDYAKAVLKLGADPNQFNSKGLPPLHQAIDSDNKALISILIQNGANPKQPEKNGLTPIEYATQANKPHLANHIAFQKRQHKIRPYITPLQKQVDQLMAMQLLTLQSLEAVSSKLKDCEPVKNEINRLHQKLSTIVAAPATSTRPKSASKTQVIQSISPEQIQESDLIELLNQHFQDMDTLVRLESDGELKLENEEDKLIIHYACAGLLMRIFHLLGIAANQLPTQLFSDELHPFRRPTAYEYRGQLMHHLFKFRGCTLTLINTAKTLTPLSVAIQELKSTGQATIDLNELSSLPIHKIARLIDGIEDAVKDQLRAGEDIDQYFEELSVLHKQAEALKNKNNTLWEQAGLLHFAITTLSCALGQRLKDIASYPAYDAIKNKLLRLDQGVIVSTTIGNQTHTATIFEIDRLRFGHAYNEENLAPGRADVQTLRKNAFVLIQPTELEKRLHLASQIASRRVGRQQPMPLFFQELKFGIAHQELDFTSEPFRNSAPSKVQNQLKIKDDTHMSTSVFQEIGSGSIDRAVPDMAFGKAQWEKYFGDVGEEPLLPSNINQILNDPCRIWPEKKVYETHILTLIPSHIDGKPLTLDYLGKLVKSPKGEGKASKFSLDYWALKTSKFSSLYFCDNEKAQVPKNYWALMAKDVLPGLRGGCYEDQRYFLSEYSGYNVPKMYEVAISIFMEHVRSGKELYNDPPTYTRCEEIFEPGGWQMIVGAFSRDGLCVTREGSLKNGNDAPPPQGMGGVKRFEEIGSCSIAPAALNMVFGKTQWEKYFGDIGEEPILPSNINQILNGPCPIWPEKKVYETHILTLIPSHIDGKPLTLEYLGELVKSPKEGQRPSQYKDMNSLDNKTARAPKNYWVLMTIDVVPSTRKKSYSDQREVLSKYSGYEVPKVYEAAIGIFVENARGGKRPYDCDPRGPHTHTRCQEISSEGLRVVVGGFNCSRLDIGPNNIDDERFGLGGARKLE